VVGLIDSYPPDISEGIPFALSQGGVLASQAFPADARFDIAVNGIGFMLRASEQNAYERASEQVRKQQFDTSTEAGEQSLSSWWIRSQVSWHMGAGIRWYEPGAEVETQYRFATSQGVDVWAEGELSLLKDSQPAGTFSADATVLTLRRGGSDGTVVASGSTLVWADPLAGGGGIATSLPTSGATQPAATGGIVWVGHTDRVSRWDTSGAGSLTTPLTCTGRARVWWVKQRLFVAVGNALYWLTPADSGAVETVGTKVAEHPDTDWVWSDVAETPDAILLSGYSASESAVLAVTVEEGDPLPVLSSPRQVAQMPRGEQVTCMGTYLGSYVVLGTTSGVRVGVIGTQGSVSYGPLTVSTSEPVVDVAFRDRFAYVAVSRALPDGSSGAARIDLSAPVQGSRGDTGLYAWAWDVSTKSTGTTSSIGFVGNTDRVVLVAGGVLTSQHPSALVSRGWVESGRVRFRTTELKAFQGVKLAGMLNDGTVEVTAVTDDGGQHRVMTYGPTTGIEGEAAVRVTNRPQLSSLAFRLFLEPGVQDGAQVSPVVTGFSVKALPTVRKSRLVKLPLSCFDFETDRHGNRVGRENGALLRVLELEALESAGAPVQLRDRRAGDAFTALIESVEYTAPANPDRALSNFGGVLTLTVRVL
jgi:hypothetical protein